MKVFIVMFWASALLVQETLGVGQPCESRRKWGGNACSLGGSLLVKSAPNNLEVTPQKCDMFLSKTEFQKQPVVTFKDANPDEKYTVVMVDPDAPKHPEGSFYLHWIEANIPGSEMKQGDFKKSNSIATYRGPSPPKGSGIHRYIVLVYRQSPLTHIASEVDDDERSMFKLEDWLSKYMLCGPESGVQFRSNFDGNPKTQAAHRRKRSVEYLGLPSSQFSPVHPEGYISKSHIVTGKDSFSGNSNLKSQRAKIDNNVIHGESANEPTKENPPVKYDYSSLVQVEREQIATFNQKKPVILPNGYKPPTVEEVAAEQARVKQNDQKKSPILAKEAQVNNHESLSDVNQENIRENNKLESQRAEFSYNEISKGSADTSVKHNSIVKREDSSLVQERGKQMAKYNWKKPVILPKGYKPPTVKEAAAEQARVKQNDQKKSPILANDEQSDSEEEELDNHVSLSDLNEESIRESNNKKSKKAEFNNNVISRDLADTSATHNSIVKREDSSLVQDKGSQIAKYNRKKPVILPKGYKPPTVKEAAAEEARVKQNDQKKSPILANDEQSDSEEAELDDDEVSIRENKNLKSQRAQVVKNVVGKGSNKKKILTALKPGNLRAIGALKNTKEHNPRVKTVDMSQVQRGKPIEKYNQKKPVTFPKGYKPPTVKEAAAQQARVKQNDDAGKRKKVRVKQNDDDETIIKESRVKQYEDTAAVKQTRVQPNGESGAAKQSRPIQNDDDTGTGSDIGVKEYQERGRTGSCGKPEEQSACPTEEVTTESQTTCKQTCAPQGHKKTTCCKKTIHRNFIHKRTTIRTTLRPEVLRLDDLNLHDFALQVVPLDEPGRGFGLLPQSDPEFMHLGVNGQFAIGDEVNATVITGQEALDLLEFARKNASEAPDIVHDYPMSP